MTYTVEHPHETQRLNALADQLEWQRVLAGWAEIRAEFLARYQMQMAAVRPQIEDTQNDPA